MRSNTACAQTTPEQQASLSTTTTANAMHWFTGWILCVGLDKLKATIKNRAIIGTATFQTQLVMQTASVRTDLPDTPTTLDSALQGAGERCTGVEDVVAALEDVFWVRFGVAYALQAGQSGFAQADVAFQISFVQCGQMIGSRSLDLASSTSTDVFLALTGWLPTMSLSATRFAIIFRSLSGNFRWKITYRVATTSTENPGAWVTDFEEAYRTAVGESCSGDLPLYLPNDMWVQLGIQYSSSSGTGSASLDFAITSKN